MEFESDSAIAKFIDKKGEGVHHIAFEVDNIFVEMERFKKKAFFYQKRTQKRIGQ